MVRRTDLIESELQLGDSFYFSGTLNLRDAAVHDVSGILRRLDNARLETITALAGVRRKRREHFQSKNRVAWDRDWTTSSLRWRKIGVVSRYSGVVCRGAHVDVDGGRTSVSTSLQSRRQ